MAATQVLTSSLGVPIDGRDMQAWRRSVFGNDYANDNEATQWEIEQYGKTKAGSAKYGGYAGDPEYERFIDANATIGADGQSYLPNSAYSQLIDIADKRQGSILTNGPLQLFTAAIGGALAGGLGGAGAASAGGLGAADVAGLTQMGIDAGLSGSALQSFISSGGTLGSTAAGGILGGAGDASWGVNAREAVDGGFSIEDAMRAVQEGGGRSLSDIFTELDAAGGRGLTGIGAGQLLNGAGTASSLIGRLLSGDAGADDYAQAIGAGLGPLMQYLGSNAQTNALTGVANQQWNAGSWARDLNKASYQPGFDLAAQPGYGDAFGKIADMSARSYSARDGNPAGNPAAQAGILSDTWNQGYLPALSNYRGGLLQAGGQGLNTSGQIGALAANNADAGYDAAAYGIGRLTTPQTNYEDIFKKMMGGMGGSNYTLRY